MGPAGASTAGSVNQMATAASTGVELSWPCDSQLTINSVTPNKIALALA